MTTLQILSIIIISVLAGIFLMTLLNMLKDRKLSEEEKKVAEGMLIQIVRQSLQLTTISDEEELIVFCVNEAERKLKELGVDTLTRQDLEILVGLVLKQLTTEIEKIKNKQKTQ